MSSPLGFREILQRVTGFSWGVGERRSGHQFLLPLPMSQTLTVKQEKFCLSYLETGNASEAYRRAYDASKMKPESVNRAAKQLLDNPKIASRIEQSKQRAAQKAEVDQERVLAELAVMAFYDPADLVLPNSEDPDKPLNITSPADIRKLPERVRRCIVGWSWDRHGNFVLKLAQKTPNLELIARHLGMLVDRKEVRVGKLETASEQELNAAIAESAREIAEQEGISVDKVMASLTDFQATAHVH
ncbi:terminase small subunit [Allopusillimonas ginsengisoli]|uniref:terminase small subunit n=1 Tax=Allopusillimonas ginsengisoli TaxID=453575 RepID=UPI0039C326D5